MPGAPKAVTPRAAFPVSAPRSERIPLGRHSKPSRIRLPHGAPIAAAPTLATVVAAFFMSQQMPANAAVAEVTPNPNHSASLDAVYSPDASSATGATSLSSSQLMLATRTVMMSDMQRAYQAAWHEKQEKASTSLPRWYTVQPGDSLSSIAQHFYDNSAAWPVLYWHNHSRIHWANDITAGQVLRIPAEPAEIPAAPSQLGPSVPTVTTHHAARHASSAPVVAQSTPTQQAPDPVPVTTTTSGSLGVIPGGAFGECVVQRESGGNPQVMNSSGHYGLFQFSFSTWVGYGGNPNDFGHASVAEQEQVFATALASPGGENNWAPYDGC
jgi:LysM repeat protein